MNMPSTIKSIRKSMYLLLVLYYVHGYIFFFLIQNKTEMRQIEIYCSVVNDAEADAFYFVEK